MRVDRSVTLGLCAFVTLSGFASNSTSAQAINKNFGFRTFNCVGNDDVMITQAMLQIADRKASGNFAGCMANATFWELGVCASQVAAARRKAIDAFMNLEYVEITCAVLEEKWAEAPVSIIGNRITLDFSLLEKPPLFVAGVIVHELMHNHGFTHRANPINTSGYNLTVPEQAAACMARGQPNSGPPDPGLLPCEPRTPRCNPGVLKNPPNSVPTTFTADRVTA